MSPLQAGPVRDLLALVAQASRAHDTDGAEERWLQERTGTSLSQLRGRLAELSAADLVIPPVYGDDERRVWRITAKGDAWLL